MMVRLVWEGLGAFCAGLLLNMSFWTEERVPVAVL